MTSEDERPFEIVAIPGKGYGGVATRSISPGELIIQEGTTMYIPVPAQQLTEKQISTAFKALAEKDKTAVLALHGAQDATHPGVSDIMRVFKSNSFGNGDACWLHPTISRINHSCVPNATTHSDPCCLGDDAQIIAEKRIQPGEEICFSYNNEIYEITTARQRAVLLGKQYGFACDCVACGGGVEGWKRDARRRMIKKLRAIVDGLQTSDFRKLDKLDPQGKEADAVLEKDLWVKEVPLKKKLPADQRIALNVLLAKLREAEGMPNDNVAINYWHAGEAMLDQMTLPQMQDLVILPWARETQRYMEKAIETMETVRNPYDHESQALRQAWAKMQKRPCLRVALAYLDGSLDAKIQPRMQSLDDDEPFAIQVTPSGELKVLYEEECNELFAIRDDVSVVSQEDEAPDGLMDKVREKLPSKKQLVSYKTLGAVFTCAAPVAAYYIMR